MPQVECKNECELIVDQYMSDIQDGSIVSCDYVKLAVARHLMDLKNGSARGLYFDIEAAEHVIRFFGLLKHSKGKWAGQFFVLEPWQIFKLWVKYGWKKADGNRRFTTSYEEEARKNGKSTEKAGEGLYALAFDNEGGSEVYSVATKEEQARITFGEGQRMAEASGRLGGIATIHKKSISIDATNSFWKPLGRDSKNQDGLNPHLVIVDEFHAHPDRSMLDVMDSAIGSREQPMLSIITTAGFNTQSACYLERDYAIKVLEGIVEDDSYFAIIFTIDEDDDWTDESVWIKANPNLGVTVKMSDMQRMCKKAEESPSALNNFLCKKLNRWTSQKVRWVNPVKWNECTDSVPESELIGKKCFSGLDLSSNTDITSHVMVFPLDDGRVVVIPRFWIPEDNARIRSKKDKVPYEAWAKQGFIKMTPGNVIDYKIVQADIQKDFELFGIDSVAFDRWNFEAIRQRLVEEGVPEDRMFAFGQGFASMSAPMKELERLYLAGLLVHNGNPVLRWMASNVSARMDPAGNIKPDKEKSTEKIDGIVALVEGLGLAITKLVKKESVYETRGILEI